MSHFDIVRQSEIDETYKVAKIRGLFDITKPKLEERFIGDFDLPDDWQIGMIVGPSGTGKTTIAKELFGDDMYYEESFIHKSVIDDFNADVSIIAKTFNSVGFSSPPSWLKPYEVLSNGEKMRVQLAQAILSDKNRVVFDEYTSVVDRNVAKIGSQAIQKAIRYTDKQFIAVGCHYDVIDWLQPDWVFDTKDMTMQKKNEKSQLSQSTFTKSKGIGQRLASITI